MTFFQEIVLKHENKSLLMHYLRIPLATWGSYSRRGV